MPTPSTIDGFIGTVTAGRYLDAINQYYHDDVKIYENEQLMQGGKAAFLEREQNMLRQNASVTAATLYSPLMNGDGVAIAWRFTITGKGGASKIFEEVAWQVWQNQKIISERFFYNPKQLA